MRNTDDIVQCVQTRPYCWSVEKGGKERGGRQIKELERAGRRETGKGGNYMKHKRCERHSRKPPSDIKNKIRNLKKEKGWEIQNQANRE